MPTITNIGPYRFFFYSNEGDEPPHVHVQRDRKLAKFWLDPLALARSSRFAPREIRTIERIISGQRPGFLDVWHEFFSS